MRDMMTNLITGHAPFSIAGRVLERETQRAVEGLRVEAWERNEADSGLLGSAVTNAQGAFRIEVGNPSSQELPSDWQQKTYFKVFRGEELLRREEDSSDRDERGNPGVVLTVHISESEAGIRADTTPVSELVALSRVEPPATLLPFLQEQGIRTLADIRNAGGIGHLAGLPVPADDPAVKALEAHANLSVLPVEAGVNERLIAAGYTDLNTIAWTSPGEFFSSMGESLSREQSTSIQVAATAQSRFLSNLLTGLRLYADGSVQQRAGALSGVLSQVCGCADCRNALSPMAYLADLLNYAVHHLKQDGQVITLTALQNRFGQPFRDLPNACEQMEKQIPQARICIEVLRKYLPAQLAMETGAAYLEAAYLTLLEQVGTSFDEIRQARSAARQQRIALADRLMLELDPQGNRPDLLDEFFRNPNPDPQNPRPEDLDEGWLMMFFGLRDSRLGALDPEPEPQLQVRQLEYLHHSWVAQDTSPTPPLAGQPVIDPDIVDEADLRDITPPSTPRAGRPKNQWTALDFLEDRASWVGATMADLETTRKNSGLPQLLDQLANTNVFGMGKTGMEGITAPELRNQRSKQQAGEDISAWLEQVKLEQREFDYLSHIVELDANSQLILKSEWSDFYAVIVQRVKRFVFFPAWLDEERQARILLGPGQFRMRTTPFTGGEARPSNPWRFDEVARRRWEDTLRARSDQEQAVTEGLRQAVRSVEERLLVELRNELLRTAALPGLLTREKLAYYTNSLQIDVQAGACQTTTRVAQAIETIQGVLFGARNGLLQGQTLDAPYFDEEWKWIGSYATWRAAMQVFLYPENALRPTLRRRPSKCFEGLLEEFRLYGKIDQEKVQEAAGEYSDYFRDVCSLTFVTMSSWDGPSQFSVARGGSTYYLIITQGGFSGKLYYCLQDRRPDYGVQSGFERTPWTALPGLGPNSEVVSILPYRDGRGQVMIGLYLRVSSGGAFEAVFTRFNGSDWSDPQQLALPSLVASFQLKGDTIPAGPVLSAAGGQGWKIRPSDRIVCLDLDGNGRDEILAVAGVTENNQRGVGLVRESAGGLFLDRLSLIPGGWDLPNNQAVILRTTLVQSPDRRREQLLVTQTVGGTTQVGLLAEISGSVAVIPLETTGSINNPGGQPWVINPQAMYLSADIDGDGFDELVAVEYPAGTQTRVTVLNVRENGISFKSSQTLISAREMAGASYEETWTRFIPVRDHLNLSRMALVISTGQEYYRMGTIVWDANNNRFSEVFEARTALLLPGSPKPVGFDAPGTPLLAGYAWQFDNNDAFRMMEWDPAAAGQELLATNSGLTSLAVLAQTGAAYEFNMLWHSERLVEPAPENPGIGWNHKTSDTLFPVDLDGDGSEEIVALDAVARQIGVLKRSTSGSLEAAWSQDLVVPQPGNSKENGWVLTSGAQLRAGDLDGDGCDEILLWVGGNQLAVLRGLPAVEPAIDLGVTAVFGPSGVREMDILPRGSEKWAASRAQNIQSAYASNTVFGDDPDLLYLDEAYYFLPMELGMRLRESALYTAALDWFRSIYDYDRKEGQRKIAYKLVLNETADFSLRRVANWLQDPLDPHAIAETRQNSYTRFTLLAIAGCLLDYADAEFSRATAESVPRARELYSQAIELLDAQEIQQRMEACSDLVGQLELKVGEGELIGPILNSLRQIHNLDTLSSTIKAIEPVLLSGASWPERLQRGQEIVAQAIDASPPAKTMGAILTVEAAAVESATAALLADPLAASNATRLGGVVARIAAGADGNTPAPADGRSLSDRTVDTPLAGVLGPPTTELHIGQYVPAPTFQFCVPPNPAVETARRHAELNLYKIRACRNIAGLELRLEPYAAPTAAEAGPLSIGTGDAIPAATPGSFQPLPYSYATLVERAKQLVELARQMEASMLAFIETSEQKKYEEIKARQDLALAQASVRLKDLQLVQSLDGVTNAQLQRDRAVIQRDYYGKLLSDGWTLNENLAIAHYYGAAIGYQGAAVAVGLSVKSFTDWWAQAGSYQAQALSTMAQVFSTYASYERREQEWRFQRQLGEQDVRIGQQQVRLAQDQVQVAGQERAIAGLQVGHAETILDFLVARRFTGSPLYEWMSGVLEGIYSFFLQQATSMAKLAEDQLAFERQERPATFIQDNYWEPPSKGLSPDFSPPNSDGQVTSTRGLTGSARLLRDLYELDQYAFRTNQRKLQLSETISLAQLDPFAFQRFRATGVLPFATPMNLFDGKFPGHYLRLVRRVRTSVIALIPPTQGIRATLSTTGTSRVVIGKDVFQEVALQRGPETVALSSPANATGLFELDVQPELLVPFEGIGVDATWEFRMPRAANLFDYKTIADVLLTIEYTALSSFDYRQEVMQRLRRWISSDRPFSFRQQFADAWYDLHHPEQVAEGEQMVVTFETAPGDFPPNLVTLGIQHVVLYFARKDGAAFEVPVSHLLFTEQGSAVPVGGAATSIDGVVSTRRGNAGAWMPMIGKTPFGKWELALPDTEEIKDRFKNEEIEDILFVITYSGNTPEWPA